MNHRTTIAALAVGASAVLGATTAAHAEPPPERDTVSASVAGDSISGYVDWSSYSAGTGRVTVYNNPNDGLCVTAQQRVMRNGVWSAWSDGHIVLLCTQTHYTTGVATRGNTLGPIQYWQFRVRDANSNWAYDTNSPGGA
jgi:hypothetical protein